jgi:hypothetical protein
MTLISEVSVHDVLAVISNKVSTMSWRLSVNDVVTVRTYYLVKAVLIADAPCLDL